MRANLTELGVEPAGSDHPSRRGALIAIATAMLLTVFVVAAIAVNAWFFSIPLGALLLWVAMLATLAWLAVGGHRPRTLLLAVAAAVSAAIGSVAIVLGRRLVPDPGLAEGALVRPDIEQMFVYWWVAALTLASALVLAVWFAVVTVRTAGQKVAVVAGGLAICVGLTLRALDWLGRLPELHPIDDFSAWLSLFLVPHAAVTATLIAFGPALLSRLGAHPTREGRGGQARPSVATAPPPPSPPPTQGYGGAPWPAPTAPPLRRLPGAKGRANVAFAVGILVFAIATPAVLVVELRAGWDGSKYDIEGKLLAGVSVLAWALVGLTVFVAHRRQRTRGWVVGFAAAALVGGVIAIFASRTGECVGGGDCSVPYLGFGEWTRRAASGPLFPGSGSDWPVSDAGFVAAMALGLAATVGAAWLAFAGRQSDADDAEHGKNDATRVLARLVAAGTLALMLLAAGATATTIRKMTDERASCDEAAQPGVDWHGCDRSNAELAGVDLAGAHLVRMQLDGATLAGADLSAATLVQSTLRGAVLTDASLDSADLSDADLRDADLSRADLTGTTLNGADLTGANLSGADLSGVALIGAVMDGADLRGANLAGAILPQNASGLALAGAVLSSTNLYGIDLRGEDLSGVDFSNASLTTVDLAGANLQHADFTRARLNNVLLTGADTTGAAWPNTAWMSTRCPDGSNSDQHDETCLGYGIAWPDATEVAAALAARGLDLDWQMIDPDPDDPADSRVAGQVAPPSAGAYAVAGGLAVLRPSATAQGDEYAQRMAEQLQTSLNQQLYGTVGRSWTCGRLAFAYVVGFKIPYDEATVVAEADARIRQMRSTLVDEGFCR